MTLRKYSLYIFLVWCVLLGLFLVIHAFALILILYLEFSFSPEINFSSFFAICRLSVCHLFITLNWLLDRLSQFLLAEDRFRPRILVDVSKIDITTTVLGFNISMPIMIAPTAMQKMAHPDGTDLCCNAFDISIFRFANLIDFVKHIVRKWNHICQKLAQCSS